MPDIVRPGMDSSSVASLFNTVIGSEEVLAATDASIPRCGPTLEGKIIVWSCVAVAVAFVVLAFVL